MKKHSPRQHLRGLKGESVEKLEPGMYGNAKKLASIYGVTPECIRAIVREEKTMSYLCGICGVHVPHGRIQRRHVIKRPDGQNEREIPVCGGCAAGLRSGYTLQQMVAMVGPSATVSSIAKVLRKTPTNIGTAPPVKPLFLLGVKVR